MIQPIGFGWVTGHLAMKHPILAAVLIGSTALGSTVYATAPMQSRLRPRNIVALTFDDGYTSDYELAAPLLDKHGFIATFYPLHDHTAWGDYMTENQIEALVSEHGWEIGSHSRTHAHLPTLTRDEVRKELAKWWAEGIEAFASPYGEFTPEIIQEVKVAGYTSHVKATNDVDYGNPLPLKDPYAIERIIYTQSTDLKSLCEKPRNPKDALVIGFHKVVKSGAKDWQINEAELGSFLECLERRGYRPYTITDLVHYHD